MIEYGEMAFGKNGGIRVRGEISASMKRAI